MRKYNKNNNKIRFRFNGHSVDNIIKRKIPIGLVSKTIEEPDLNYVDNDGKIVSIKNFDGHNLKVVYRSCGMIVTAYFIDKWKFNTIFFFFDVNITKISWTFYVIFGHSVTSIFVKIKYIFIADSIYFISHCELKSWFYKLRQN